MILFNNGLVVQAKYTFDQWYSRNSITKDTPGYIAYRAYNGIGKYYSWPLEKEKDAISEELTREAEERWFAYYYSSIVSANEQQYALRVVPDNNFCQRYLKHCKNRAIETRIFFCKTEREGPLWDSDIPMHQHLGYDYASSGLYSPIPDDLLLPPLEKYLTEPIYRAYLECKQWLNKSKLFNTQTDILEFVRRRKIVEESDIEWEEVRDETNGVGYSHLVEPAGDSVVFEIAKVLQPD